jgi:hypothetical protein
MWLSCGSKLASPDMCYSQNTVLKSREVTKTGLHYGLGERGENLFGGEYVRKRHRKAGG